MVRPTPLQVDRYARQIALPELGRQGQMRLRAASILIVGAGGLGCPAALYLAAAGVGTLTIVDFDVVDETNLQRQVLFSSADAGRKKVDIAAGRLTQVNPDVRVQPVDDAFSSTNARALVAAADVVIDGTDNFATRYLVNDACVLYGRPNVFGSVASFEGQAAVFAADGGPCYRCLHPDPPPPGAIASCAEAGILGVLPGLIGIVQATEAIKLLSGIGDPLVGRMLIYDARRMRVRDIRIPRDPECPICGPAPSIRTLEPVEVVCAADLETEIAVAELEAWRAAGRPLALVDVREPWEHAARHLEGDRLIPLGTLSAAVDALPSDRPIIVYCETGRRSAEAAALLRRHGRDGRTLTGGIRAWYRSVRPDPPVSPSR